MVVEFGIEAERDIHAVAVALKSLAVARLCEFIYPHYTFGEARENAPKRQKLLSAADKCLDELEKCFAETGFKNV